MRYPGGQGMRVCTFREAFKLEWNGTEVIAIVAAASQYLYYLIAGRTGTLSRPCLTIQFPGVIVQAFIKLGYRQEAGMWAHRP